MHHRSDRQAESGVFSAEGHQHYLLVVTYHYLAEATFPYPGIHPLTPQQFKDQVEVLGRCFEFISQADILRALEGTRSLPERACLLTFDDGLQEQYRYAVPVLEELSVPAVFFIPGRPYAEHQPLTIHKLHWLRSRTPPATFLQAVKESCNALEFSDRVEAVAGANVAGKYFWDDAETRKVKYLFNVLLSAAEQERLVDCLLDGSSDDGHAYFEELYFTRDQIRELDQRFAVGTHSYSHAALGRMSESAVEEDIVRSIAALSDVAESPVSISYPSGFEEAVSPMVISVAERCGLRIGFTKERAFNRTLDAPLALARIDTNDAPGGKRPIVFLNGDGFDVAEPMTLGRTRYIREISAN